MALLRFMDRKAGWINISGIDYAYATSEKIPPINFPELVGWKDLYFKDDKGNEATVVLKPGETIEEKIIQTVLERKW